MRDKVEQLQADIEAGVAELVDGEDWQSWLRVAARFPKYSFRNTLLIRMQRPDATAVMGYRAWQALGHQVRKGEKICGVIHHRGDRGHQDGCGLSKGERGVDALPDPLRLGRRAGRAPARAPTG